MIDYASQSYVKIELVHIKHLSCVAQRTCSMLALHCPLGSQRETSFSLLLVGGLTSLAFPPPFIYIFNQAPPILA